MAERKQDYFSIRLSIPAQRHKKLPVYGDYVAILDNSLLVNPVSAKYRRAFRSGPKNRSIAWNSGIRQQTKR